MENILSTLNAEQQEAAKTTEGALLILAGAGSGKTRVLTTRIAYMIKQGAIAGKILAVTFTNKAAGEMRERVDNLVGFGSESIWVSTFHSSCVKIIPSFSLLFLYCFLRRVFIHFTFLYRKRQIDFSVYGVCFCLSLDYVFTDSGCFNGIL